MILNFTISELIKSDTAMKYNINNMPDIKSLDNMLILIAECLQPLRDKIGKPIRIMNGYRSFNLWKKFKDMGLNPSKTSQHLEGKAVDIAVTGISQRDLFNFIRLAGIEYDQLIWEQDSNCVHISYNKGHNRKESLIRDLKGDYTRA